MTGIIDVGGGLRGIFGCGVLDYCLDNHIQFPYCIGVSAGSANIASYLSAQRGRNYVFYTQYAMRKEYMSMRNFARRGSYIDLDYVYGTLANSDGENPADYDAMSGSGSQFIIVATDANTGEPTYFRKEQIMRDKYDVFKASSCIPLVCRAYPIDDGLYYDGGLSDPIPIDKAFADGCGKVVIVLTRPADFRRKGGKDAALARLIRRRYPCIAGAMERRHRLYNEGVERAHKLVRQGRALLIAPDDCCGVDTLTKDAEKLKLLYQKGYEAAAALKDFL